MSFKAQILRTNRTRSTMWRNTKRGFKTHSERVTKINYFRWVGRNVFRVGARLLRPSHVYAAVEYGITTGEGLRYMGSR